MKKVLISIFMVIGLYASEGEDDSYIDVKSLVVVIESLQEDVGRMSERIDKISEQSYQARLATKKDKEAIALLAKNFVAIKKELQKSKPKKSLNFSNTDASLKQGQTYYKITASSGLKLRSRPDKKGIQKNILVFGTTVYAICTNSSSWCYLPDLQGYMSKGYLKKVETKGGKNGL